MSFLDSYLVDQKLNKYHRLIEREKAETSEYITTPRAKTNTQHTSSQGISTNFTTNFSSNRSTSPITRSYQMAPYSQKDNFSFNSSLSQSKTNSFMTSNRNKSRISDSDDDYSENLFKKSIQVITKIERHTRSSSSSRAQSPSSPRSQKNLSQDSSTSTPPKNSNKPESEQDEERDLQISDLENSPKNASNETTNSNNSPAKSNSPKGNKDYMDIKDSTSPLKALKRGLSSIFISQFHKKNNNKDESNDYKSSNIKTITSNSPRSRSLTNSNKSYYGSPSFSPGSDFEQSSWMKIPARHSPNFILSDGSNDSPSRRYHLSSRSSSPSRSPKTNKYSPKYNDSIKEQNFASFSSSLNKSRSPPSPTNKSGSKYSYQSTVNRSIKQKSFSSDSTEENIFAISKNTGNNLSSYHQKSNFSIKPTKSPLKFSTKFDSIEVSSDTESDQFLSFNKRNYNFSSKTTNLSTRYTNNSSTNINDELSSSDTESNYNFNQYDNDDFIRNLPKAETKLTKKFSKQISSLFSPENQRRKDYVIISDSDSSSSSNFHPKPPPFVNSKFRSGIDDNISKYRSKTNSFKNNYEQKRQINFNTLSSSDSDSEYHQSTLAMTRTTLNNDDISTSSEIEPIKHSNYQSSSINGNSFGRISNRASQYSNISSYSLKSTSLNRNSNQSQNLGSSGLSSSRNTEVEIVTGSPHILRQSTSKAPYRFKPSTINLNNDSDSEDEFFEALKDTIKANESVLNSLDV